MKTILFLIVISSSLCLSQEQANDKNVDANDINFIISTNASYSIKLEDAASFAKVLGNILVKELYGSGMFYTHVVKNDKEALSKIMPCVNVIVLQVSEYLSVSKTHPSLLPFAVGGTYGGQGNEYLLLVRNESKINSIKDLKGASISVLSRDLKRSTMALWIDKLLRDEKLPQKETFFNNIFIDYRSTNVITSLFFKKTDAGFITASAFDIESTLNPQLKRELKILAQSEKLLAGIICVLPHKNSEKEKVDNTVAEFLKLDKHQTGKQALALFKIDKLLPYRKEYLNSYLELLK